MQVRTDSQLAQIADNIRQNMYLRLQSQASDMSFGYISKISDKELKKQFLVLLVLSGHATNAQMNLAADEAGRNELDKVYPDGYVINYWSNDYSM